MNNIDLIPIIYRHLDLKSKLKISLLNKEYLKIFNLYKKNKLYTNTNIRQLYLIIHKWKYMYKNKIINNSWSPKRKPFDRIILLS